MARALASQSPVLSVKPLFAEQNGWHNLKVPPEHTRGRAFRLPGARAEFIKAYPGDSRRGKNHLSFSKLNNSILVRRPGRRGRIPSQGFTAPTPAVAATPSCGAVPPLTPIAPANLPLRTMGRPPSEAIGRAPSGKDMKAALPAANWSAKTLEARRNSAEVRALACASRAEELWVPSIFSK